MSETIEVYTCPNGHAFFVTDDACPKCGEPLETTTAEPIARLISHTTVRVNPTGRPFVLGIAEIDNGAKTLCIVEGELSDLVVLRKHDGLYHARAVIG